MALEKTAKVADKFSLNEDELFNDFERESKRDGVIHSHYTNVDGVGATYVVVKKSGTLINPLDITIGVISNRDMPNRMNSGDCAKFVISMDNVQQTITDFREHEPIGNSVVNDSAKLGGRSEQIGFLQQKLGGFLASEAIKAKQSGTSDGREAADVLQRFLHAKPKVTIFEGKAEFSELELMRLGVKTK